MDLPGARDELVELERRFWLEGGGNPDFWRHHFADDGLVALPFGILGKDETVRIMEQAQPWESVDMRDVQVVPVADDAALVTYQASGRRNGADDYAAVIGSVYVHRDGAWALAFHQQSPPG